MAAEGFPTVTSGNGELVHPLLSMLHPQKPQQQSGQHAKKAWYHAGGGRSNESISCIPGNLHDLAVSMGSVLQHSRQGSHALQNSVHKQTVHWQEGEPVMFVTS